MTGRRRVLVVDDEDRVCELMQVALERCGYAAETARSAEAGLELFDAGRFDLVVTDLYLPGMNGDQFARMIKRQDGEIPIILLTAYPPAQVPPDVDSILVKPFSVDALKEAIAQARR